MLDVEDLLLAIHEPSLPSDDDEDTGRGAAASRGTARLLELVAELGFTGILWGPTGRTSPSNPSPYDGTAFARGLEGIALAPLVDGAHGGPLLDADEARRIVAGVTGRGAPLTSPAEAATAVAAVLDRVALRVGATAGIGARLATFRRDHAAWLEPDGLYLLLAAHHGHADPARWRETSANSSQAAIDQWLWSPPPGSSRAAEERRAALVRAHEPELHRHALEQLLVHEQHAMFRERLESHGLKLLGDLQVGLSFGDRWRHAGVLLRGYSMGAPPSRTNPAGQPWGYPVLDPTQLGSRERPGPALELVEARLAKVLAEFDGVRIDHPHGLVCPWVYRESQPDPYGAVRGGARLYAAPHLSDHPELARHAIALPEDIDERLPRYADGWVTRLSDRQLAAYARPIDVVMDVANALGRRREDVVCEVLSTLPYPLERVLDRHGLGRFRVTQKARLDDPGDVYRIENAAPQDWVMVGTHDTPPIWHAIDRWRADGVLAARADYLAARLEPDASARPALARRLTAEPCLLAQAELATLFASRARHVVVFFADLFGLRELYNRPGVVHELNWRLRLPPTFAADYRRRRSEGNAADIPRVLAWALGARPELGAAGLARRLEARAGSPPTSGS